MNKAAIEAIKDVRERVGDQDKVVLIVTDFDSGLNTFKMAEHERGYAITMVQKGIPSGKTAAQLAGRGITPWVYSEEGSDERRDSEIGRNVVEHVYIVFDVNSPVTQLLESEARGFRVLTKILERRQAKLQQSRQNGRDIDQAEAKLAKVQKVLKDFSMDVLERITKRETYHMGTVRARAIHNHQKPPVIQGAIVSVSEKKTSQSVNELLAEIAEVENDLEANWQYDFAAEEAVSPSEYVGAIPDVVKFGNEVKFKEVREEEKAKVKLEDAQQIAQAAEAMAEADMDEAMLTVGEGEFFSAHQFAQVSQAQQAEAVVAVDQALAELPARSSENKLSPAQAKALQDLSKEEEEAKAKLENARQVAQTAEVMAEVDMDEAMLTIGEGAFFSAHQFAQTAQAPLPAEAVAVDEALEDFSKKKDVRKFVESINGKDADVDDLVELITDEDNGFIKDKQFTPEGKLLTNALVGILEYNRFTGRPTGRFSKEGKAAMAQFRALRNGQTPAVEDKGPFEPISPPLSTQEAFWNAWMSTGLKKTEGATSIDLLCDDLDDEEDEVLQGLKDELQQAIWTQEETYEIQDSMVKILRHQAEGERAKGNMKNASSLERQADILQARAEKPRALRESRQKIEDLLLDVLSHVKDPKRIRRVLRNRASDKLGKKVLGWLETWTIGKLPVWSLMSESSLNDVLSDVENPEKIRRVLRNLASEKLGKKVLGWLESWTVSEFPEWSLRGYYLGDSKDRRQAKRINKKDKLNSDFYSLVRTLSDEELYYRGTGIQLNEHDDTTVARPGRAVVANPGLMPPHMVAEMADLLSMLYPQLTNEQLETIGQGMSNFLADGVNIWSMPLSHVVPLTLMVGQELNEILAGQETGNGKMGQVAGFVRRGVRSLTYRISGGVKGMPAELMELSKMILKLRGEKLNQDSLEDLVRQVADNIGKKQDKGYKARMKGYNTEIAEAEKTRQEAEKNLNSAKEKVKQAEETLARLKTESQQPEPQAEQVPADLDQASVDAAGAAKDKTAQIKEAGEEVAQANKDLEVAQQDVAAKQAALERGKQKAQAERQIFIPDAKRLVYPLVFGLGGPVAQLGTPCSGPKE
jgi:hypothetical protein